MTEQESTAVEGADATPADPAADGSAIDDPASMAPAPDASPEAGIRSLADRLDELTAKFDRRIATDTAHRKGLEALNLQLAWTRDQAEARSAFPLIRQLLLIVDRLDQHIGATGDAFADSVREEILGCLRVHGVTRLPWAQGTFDAAYQEAVAVVPVHEAERSRQVHGLIRHGYRHDNVLLRPQAVEVCQMTTQPAVSDV
ncbi:nucleotide exchange factor GrpE [Streptomyces sp. NBC_00648]|uniref:nucleotide exchange factor GrpE n=1 Tax=Streptomyces sp. NBC_00648 TaxID=2975797 RepID=UPI003253181F